MQRSWGFIPKAQKATEHFKQGLLCSEEDSGKLTLAKGWRAS